MGKIKAIIFDLDGVLVDAGDWHYRALSRALADHGFSLTRKEHALRYEGLPTKEKLKLLTRLKDVPAGLHAAISGCKQRYTTAAILSGCRPRKAQIKMLARLKSEKYSLAVASNCIRKTVKLMLATNGLLGYFDAVLSNQDVAKAKPDPEIYQKAFVLLKTEPKACLILEDHPAGLKAARDSGANVLRVARVGDVTYGFIKARIRAIEKKTC